MLRDGAYTRSCTPSHSRKRTSVICTIRMVMFGGKHKKGESTIEVLLALRGADSVSVAVSEEASQ